MKRLWLLVVLLYVLPITLHCAKHANLDEWTVDYADLHNKKTWAQAYQKIHKACRETGFVVITNPPLKEKEIDHVYSESRLFFELPEKEKRHIIGNRCHYQRGYCPLRLERAKDHFLGDLRESFTGALYPSDHYPELWPNRKMFGKVTKAMSLKLMDMGKEMLEVLAMASGLDHQCLSSYIEGPTPSVFRSIHYPAFPCYARKRLWAAEHTDITLVTVILPPWIKDKAYNQIEGIEVQNKKGVWESLIVPKNSVIVRVGDLLANLSNGYFKSARCRVRDTHSCEAIERYVMVLYAHPPGSTNLAPLSCFVERTGGKVCYPRATRDELVSERLVDINFGDDAMVADLAHSDLIERLKAFKMASPRVIKKVKDHRRLCKHTCPNMKK